MFCPNCGAENREGSKFCAVCGSPLYETPQEPADEEIFGEYDSETPDEPKKGFFRRPAGIVVIIVIIAAAAVAVVFSVLHVRAVRQSREAGEELVGEEMAEAFSDEDEDTVSFITYDVDSLPEECEDMYAPIETCVYVLSGDAFTYDWDDPVFVWDSLVELINNYEGLFYDETPNISDGYLWVSEDVVKECASALFADFDGELPEIPSTFTVNPVKNGNLYGIKVGDRGIDGDGRYITSWQEYSDGSAVVEMSNCAPEDRDTVYSTFSIDLVKNEYTEDMTDPLFVYSITDVEKTYENPDAYSQAVDTAEYYILPESDTRYYTEEELSSLTADQLRLARNEIYARHGRTFDKEDLQAYFDSQPWYRGTIAPDDFDDSVFNEYEKANVQLIQSVEDGLSAASDGSADVTFFNAGDTCSVDLDGDGTEETVHVYMDSDNWQGCLEINGKLCATIDWAFDIGEFSIVDIDTSDKTLQVGITSYEEDSEVATYFYGYNSGNVQELGRIQGAFHGDEPYPNIVCPGDGTVEAYRPLYIFETWFADTTFILRDGELMEIVPSVYVPLDLFDGWGIDLTVLKPILVEQDDPYSGERFALPGGTKIHMNGTDNQNWVSFTADGYDGTLYLWVSDGYYIETPDSPDYQWIEGYFDNRSLFG